LAPGEVDEGSKRELVTILGGHPVALALAADAVFQDGIEEVLSQLRSRGGFWKTYVEQLVRSLDLTEEDPQTLRGLSGYRTPIAREVIQQAVSYALRPVMRKLITLCLVDVLPDGRLWLSSLLRVHWHLSELPEASQRTLHEKAAGWYQRCAHDSQDLGFAIEAEYHGQLAGMDVTVTSGLLDAHISSAWTLYEQQQYERAKTVTDQILTRKRSRDILRLSALIDSRTNHFETALVKARDVFSEDRTDTWFLHQIAKAALDGDRTDIVADLVKIAQVAGVEDDRLAVVEGRMFL